MLSLDDLVITVGARDSLLSQKQVEEVLQELRVFHSNVVFTPIFIKTTGDLDLQTSLRTLDKSDFFTKEVDEMVLQGRCRIGIHSAKDLPDPIPEGLAIVALTKGVDPSDALVLRKDHKNLPARAKIGSSSPRRDQAIREILPDAVCADIRGTIQSRLGQLDAGEYDAVVIAEAALIRLGLTHRTRIRLANTGAPLQGRLAVVAREDDGLMKEVFLSLEQ